MIARAGRAAGTGLLALLAVGFLAPVVWAIIGSLKPADELMMKPWSLPSRVVWANFQAALEGHILRYLLNSTIVTVAAVAAMLVVGVPAAYAFARLPMRGRGVLLGLAVSGILLPAHAALIPVYELSQQMHVANLPALVGPYVAFGLPLTILLLRAYFAGLPGELVDAAVVDGASHWRIAWQVFVPMAMPALATVAIFQAVWIWNELPFALVLTRDPLWQTLPRGLLSFQGEHTSNWGAILAGVVVAMTPVIALYVVLQRHVTRGLTAGAVKG
jgi:raffinose/stachyose/melibiose transport system permease protein